MLRNILVAVKTTYDLLSKVWGSWEAFFNLGVILFVRDKVMERVVEGGGMR